MIGLFDSGTGGLTVCRALVERFPDQPFIYLGDHANVPYGNRTSQDIVELTRAAVETLFSLDCRLVILACNTATAIACRTLQQKWLPSSDYAGHNVLGVVAPMVEAATQTPWAVTTPQYPQKYNTETIGVFGTHRTIDSGVYPEEISKRCPRVTVVEQDCPELVSAIESGKSENELSQIVEGYVSEMLAKTPDTPPERVILGCTHFPLVEHLFKVHLPSSTRVFSQPQVVADSMEDYLSRHVKFASSHSGSDQTQFLTTGEPNQVEESLRLFWPETPRFQRA